MQHLQKDAIGAAIELTVTEDGEVVDLSDVVTKNLIFRKPGGSQVEKLGAFVTDGSDGKLRYVTESGFLDRAGLWKIQAYLEFPETGAYKGNGDVGEFRVKDNA